MNDVYSGTFNPDEKKRVYDQLVAIVSGSDDQTPGVTIVLGDGVC